jgi:hypothetical protein
MKNEKHNPIYRIGIIYCMVSLFSCTPAQRFARLIEKHPYLIETTKKDTISIRVYPAQDTTFIFKKEHDTIIFDNHRIERFRDTFRFFYKQSNCTTYVNKTVYQPSKYVTKEIQKRQERSVRDLSMDIFSVVILVLSLLVVLIRK